jgi:NAD-dependent SIR2 family protein deacetylase
MLSSLQITPACNLPLKAVRAGGKMVIVNLQVCFFATSCPSWMTKQKHHEWSTVSCIIKSFFQAFAIVNSDVIVFSMSL